MDAKELKALDTLHNSPVDVDGGVFSPLSPIVSRSPPRLTDIEIKVVVLAPDYRYFSKTR